MMVADTKRVKLVEQFEAFFFNGRHRFTNKLVRVLLIVRNYDFKGNKKAKLLGLVHFLDTLNTH